MTRPQQVECVGGPLDGEFRPIPQGIGGRFREVCAYAEENPEYLFPRATYHLITHHRWGVILEFQGMDP